MSSIIILIFQFQGYEMVSFETIVVPPPPPGEESDEDKPVWDQAFFLKIWHYEEFAISSLPQNFFKKMHRRASKFFQLIFAQTCKISFQEVFFLSSRPVPPLWGPPGLISGIKLFLRE